MFFNSANKVVKPCIEEVVVPFEGKGADGCGTGVYNCEGDEGRGSSSCVDVDAWWRCCSHGHCDENEMRR